MLKFSAGFVTGFLTLLILVFLFGNYSDATPTPAVVAQAPAIAPTDTPVPFDTPTTIPTTTPQPTWTPVPTKVPAAPPAPATVGMNQDLIVDNVRWKALGIEEAGNHLHSDNQFAKDVTTPGKYVRVTFEIENRHAKPEMYASPHLMDAQGRRYNSLDMGTMYVPTEQDCVAATFNPGVAKTCADVFEVAVDASGYKLIANNLTMFNATEGTIELK